jgi:DNA topoisomerase IB
MPWTPEELEEVERQANKPLTEEEERLSYEYWENLGRQLEEQDRDRPKRRRSEMTAEEIEFLAEMDSDEQEEFMNRHFLPKNASFPFSKRAKDHNYVSKKEEESGNVTYLYDKKHIAARNRGKEKRLKKLSGSLTKMRAKVKKDLSSDDDKTRLAALAVALIDETYERVGNEESASEMKHYGVTSWLLKHVTFGKGKATLRYVGKSGIKQVKEVKIKPVLTALKRACKDKKKGDRILDGISAKDVNAYLASFHITAKDIRGYHANKEMLRALKAEGKPPKGDEKALKEHFKKALEDAAKKVGHEPSTLKRQYLIPRIEQYYMEGKSVRGILASQTIPFSKLAERHNVKEEYIWMWDDKGRRLKTRRNVENGKEIKGIDHASLAEELGISAREALDAPRGFVTYPAKGPPEVATYGVPFSRLLDISPRAYNAVERVFELMPGAYRQEVLPMPRGSHEAIMEAKPPLSKRKDQTVEASQLPISRRAAGLMDIPPQMVEQAAAWIKQAHAAMCLAIYWPPPEAAKVEKEIAAARALEAKARADARILHRTSWTDTPKIEEQLLGSWDGHKGELRVSNDNGTYEIFKFRIERQRPQEWSVGIQTLSSTTGARNLPVSGHFQLETVLVNLAEKLDNWVHYKHAPDQKTVDRRHELHEVLKTTAGGLQVDAMRSLTGGGWQEEIELPVDMMGWKYESLVTSGLPWSSYVLEARAGRDPEAAAYYQKSGEVDKIPKIVVFVGNLLPWSVEIFAIEQEALVKSARHEMVHLSQDLLRGALRLKIQTGLPPMSVRQRKLDPSGHTRPSMRELRRQHKRYPESSLTYSYGPRLKHPLRDIEFQSNLRDSVEEWRKSAAPMTPDQRREFLKFWVKGDHMGYHETGLPSVAFSASAIFRTLRAEARGNKPKKDRWVAAVRLFVAAVKDMLQQPTKVSNIQFPFTKRAAAALESLTPNDVDELAQWIAQQAIEGIAENTALMVHEQRDSQDSFGPQTIMADGGSILQLADEIAWDLLPSVVFIKQKAFLRQLLLDLGDMIKAKRLKMPYELNYGLLGALRRLETKDGHAKLNRSQQREIAPDWNALVITFSQKLMDAVAKKGKDAEWVVTAYMPHGVDAVLDMVAEYQPEDAWSQAGQKFKQLKVDAATNEEAAELLEKTREEIREKARKLVPKLIREQFKWAADSVPLSKRADRPSEWGKTEPFWFLPQRSEFPKGYRPTMWNSPHPNIQLPNIALREEENAKLLEAQTRLPDTVLVGVAPLEMTSNKGETFTISLAYMPLQVILKGKQMPAITALERLKTLRGADGILLDGIIERIKEQRGSKSSYLYDVVPQKQENPIPYLELSEEYAENLDDLARQAGWPSVVTHPTSSEGGHSRRLPTLVTDKHGRQVRVGKLLTLLKKQFPGDAYFLTRIEKDLSLLPRINEWELVVSAEPADILTMSTGRGWHSCVTEGEVNFASLDYAVSTRDMVAYAVAPGQKNWIARVWLRSDGKGKWWPEPKVYTTMGISNQAILDAANNYLASKGILGQQGDYHVMAKGYSDLLKGQIKQNKRVELAQEFGAYYAVPEKPDRPLRHVPKTERYRRYEVDTNMDADEFIALLTDLAGQNFDVLGQKIKDNPKRFDLKLPIEVAEALEGMENIMAVRDKGKIPEMVTISLTIDPLEPQLLAIMAEHLMDPDLVEVTTMSDFMRLPENTRENILDEKAADIRSKMPPWASFERQGFNVIVTLPKTSLMGIQKLFPKITHLPKKASQALPSRFAKESSEEEEYQQREERVADMERIIRRREEEFTSLYQLVGLALKETKGYDKLPRWQQELFDDVADALWKKDLARAQHYVEQILKFVVASFVPLISKRAETSNEKEITFLFQLLAEALREAGGFKKLEPWLKSRFEDIVDALWKGDLQYARKLVDRFLTYLKAEVKVPLSRRLSWDDRPPLAKRVYPAASNFVKGAPPG